MTQDYTLYETQYFRVRQVNEYCVPGYLIIESLNDMQHLDDFDADARRELMDCLVQAEQLVNELLHPPRVYIMQFAEVNPRIHFHVFPRTQLIGEAFEKATNQTAPYNGAALVEWVWRHHASLGFSEGDQMNFVSQARDWLDIQH